MMMAAVVWSAVAISANNDREVVLEQVICFMFIDFFFVCETSFDSSKLMLLYFCEIGEMVVRDAGL